MTIKIEFPADRTDIALAIGQALTAIGQGKEGAPIETGPFYWLHHESESYGTVETRAELEAMIDSGDGLVNEASKEHYDETTAAWDQAVAEANVAAKLAEEECPGVGKCDDRGCPAHYATPEEEELDEYESFVWDYVGDEKVKKHGAMLRKAIGVYEHQAMNKGEELVPFGEITKRLREEELVTFYSAEHVLDNIRQVTKEPAGGKSEQSTAAHAAGGAQGATGANVDEKGVAFNGEFCSKAAIPFYGSGKKKGQWKKRQGVDEGAYDDWYADELFSGKIEDSGQEQANETTSDSNVAANAFGNNTATNTQTDEATPQDAGQLMKWVSEQQAASNITQQQVTDAYTALQLPFDAVMNPAYPVADNCAAIYNHLKGQI